MAHIEGSVLVLVANDNGEDSLSHASQKALRLAKGLTGGKVYALSLDPSPDREALADCGTDTVFVPQAPGYSNRVPAGVAAAAQSALSTLDQVGLVLLVGTYLGRAVTAILATSIGGAGAVDVTDVSVSEGSVIAQKSALGGAWVTTLEATSGLPVLALRPGAGSEQPVARGEAELVPLPVSLPATATAVEVIASTQEPRGARIGLTDANVVVVGGRGVDGDFTLVEELADHFGGAVGATRVACDEGWVQRSAQIGQTGFSIAPKLYIGLGVSGAVHHTCGMLGSETIVAVVDDPDAPILELADFAVVGDVSEIVPQALEALKEDA